MSCGTPIGQGTYGSIYEVRPPSAEHDRGTVGKVVLEPLTPIPPLPRRERQYQSWHRHSCLLASKMGEWGIAPAVHATRGPQRITVPLIHTTLLRDVARHVEKCYPQKRAVPQRSRVWLCIFLCEKMLLPPEQIHEFVLKELKGIVTEDETLAAWDQYHRDEQGGALHALWDDLTLTLEQSAPAECGFEEAYRRRGLEEAVARTQRWVQKAFEKEEGADCEFAVGLHLAMLLLGRWSTYVSMVEMDRMDRTLRSVLFYPEKVRSHLPWLERRLLDLFLELQVRGIAYCDVKMENIMVRLEGDSIADIKLIDFDASFCCVVQGSSEDSLALRSLWSNRPDSPLSHLVHVDARWSYVFTLLQLAVLHHEAAALGCVELLWFQAAEWEAMAVENNRRDPRVPFLVSAMHASRRASINGVATILGYLCHYLDLPHNYSCWHRHAQDPITLKALVQKVMRHMTTQTEKQKSRLPLTQARAPRLSVLFQEKGMYFADALNKEASPRSTDTDTDTDTNTDTNINTDTNTDTTRLRWAEVWRCKLLMCLHGICNGVD